MASEREGKAAGALECQNCDGGRILLFDRPCKKCNGLGAVSR